MEGVIAAGIGAGTGAVAAAPSGVGVLPAAVIGAIFGAVLKSPIAMMIIAGIVLFLFSAGTSFSTGIPFWIIGIALLFLFLIFRRNK